MTAIQKTYIGPERREYQDEATDIASVFDRKLRDHEERETARIQALIDLLKVEAFPDGPVAHRMAHQAMIDAAKAQELFWSGLKTDIAKRSLFGILHILFLLLMAGLAVKLGVTNLFGMGIK